MMGLQTVGESLFYEFRLEAHVPADHSLRKIDALLDLSELRASLQGLYSHTGRQQEDLRGVPDQADLHRRAVPQPGCFHRRTAPRATARPG